MTPDAPTPGASPSSTPAGGSTYVLIARMPPAGVQQFQDYESNVIPLIARHGGRLERRLRTADELTEVHVIWFPSEEAFLDYRGDPERTAQVPLLVESGAVTELLELSDVAVPGGA